MIQLTEEQVTAMEQTPGPLRVVNPKTQEVYFLIRQDVYELTRGIVGGGKGKVWDDQADDDLIRKKS
jgi:hypothetical protein